MFLEITRITGWDIESKLSERFKIYSSAMINMQFKKEKLKKLKRIKLESAAARTEVMKSCEFFLLLSF